MKKQSPTQYTSNTGKKLSKKIKNLEKYDIWEYNYLLSGRKAIRFK